MLAKIDGKTYIKASRKDACNILAALTTTTSSEETPVMAEAQSIPADAPGQPPCKGTIRCASCGQTAPRTGPSQTYCYTCSDNRSRERKRKWARKHPPPKEYVCAREKKKRSRLQERGAAISEANKSSLENLFRNELPLSWHIRLAFPFSYAYSKNHSHNLSDHGHIYLRRQTKKLRSLVAESVALAVAGVKVVHAKVKIDLIVQKPNHKGDAINILDIVADGIKDGLAIDDRWFRIIGLDWEVVKSDPQILLGIGQDDATNHRVCSYCGQIKPFESFVKNKGCPNGYSRICLECDRAKRVKV